ncbi:hypothetical protein [Marinoscillum pacificum]|uniref:hypothetical protein n=1 Tax=Marinoscillum pacificum TaxID=392723 RepID=UPI0021582E5E|nr:hypothetical protein [Marinoscillum pacificum]
MMKYALYLICLIGSYVVFAQEEPPSGEIEDAQIIIEKDKPLTLPKANRVYLKSSLRPLTEDTVSLKYQLSEPQISLETLPFTPSIRGYETKYAEISQNNYVKLGFGNYLSPLLQAYVGTELTDGNSVGAYVFHESFATGPVRDEKSAYGDTKVDVMGKLTNESLTFYPLIEFEREAFFYYGYADDVEPEITDKVGLNQFALAAPVSFVQSDEVSVVFTPTFQTVTMGYDGKAFNQDNGVTLDLNGQYQLSDELAAYGGISFETWKYTSGYSSTRNIFGLNPGVIFSKDALTIKAGALVAIGKDDSTSGVNIYPDVAIDFSVSDQLGIFIDATGGLYTTNLNDLRMQNRYLDDSLTLLNENNKIRIKGGINYALRPDLTLEPFVEYTYSTYQPLFYHSVADSARFAVGYDVEGLGTTNFGATVRLINKKSSLIGQMIISAYQPTTVEEAWYLPTTQLKVNYTQEITPKFQLSAGAKVLQGIKAPSPVDGEAIDLSTVFDMSLGGKYRIDHSWSAFVQINNLLGTNYERYLNYPVRGFTGKIGVIWRF